MRLEKDTGKGNFSRKMSTFPGKCQLFQERVHLSRKITVNFFRKTALFCQPKSGKDSDAFRRFSVSVVFDAGKRSKFNSIFIYKYRSIFLVELVDFLSETLKRRNAFGNEPRGL